MRNLSAALLALAACGQVHALTDGSTGDGNNIDATPPVTKVTVIVLDPQNTGAPVAGIPVVFVDNAGTAVGHPPTDAEGKASADLPNGGAITAVLPSGTDYTMKTVLGVKPGDTITLGLPAPDNSTETFTVTLATNASAANYYVYGPCGQQTSAANLTTATMTVYGYCKQPTMDLVAVAYDANNNAIGWVEKSGVAYSPGMTVGMPGTWQSMKNITVTATNIPAEATYAYAYRYWPDQYGFYAYGTGMAPTAGSYSASMSGPNSASAMVETALQGTNGNVQRIRQVNAGNATAYNIDVGNNLLTWIGQPSLDVTNAKITIPTSGSNNGTPDLFQVYVSYSRTLDGGFTRFSWFVYAPDVTDLTLPTLPAEVGDVAPRAGDSAGFSTSAALVDFDDVAGYDAARAHPDGTMNHFYDQANRTSQTARLSQSPLIK